MSRYLFGLQLDGAPAPHDQKGLQTSVCGPESLLTALEASLGLPPTDTPLLQRTLAYRDLVEASLNDEHFYARSFRCDSLATARLLLSWRDTLHAAGWHGALDHDKDPPRLQGLAALSTHKPICLSESHSLLHDLRTAHEQRRRQPSVYESLLREARDIVLENLITNTPRTSLFHAVIEIAPHQLWSWPATASPNPSLHRRLAHFILPHILHPVIEDLSSSTNAPVQSTEVPH